MTLALVGAVVGALRKDERATRAGQRALTIGAGFVGVATIALVIAFITHDFSFAYVANYSSRSLSGAYRVTALWGGMEGSLLFWTLLLSVFAAIALARSRSRDTSIKAWTAVVLGGVVTSTFLSLFVLILAAGYPKDALFAGAFRHDANWGATLAVSSWQIYQWYGDDSAIQIESIMPSVARPR